MQTNRSEACQHQKDAWKRVETCRAAVLWWMDGWIEKWLDSHLSGIDAGNFLPLPISSSQLISRRVPTAGIRRVLDLCVAVGVAGASVVRGIINVLGMRGVNGGVGRRAHSNSWRDLGGRFLALPKVSTCAVYRVCVSCLYMRGVGSGGVVEGEEKSGNGMGVLLGTAGPQRCVICRPALVTGTTLQEEPSRCLRITTNTRQSDTAHGSGSGSGSIADLRSRARRVQSCAPCYSSVSEGGS